MSDRTKRRSKGILVAVYRAPIATLAALLIAICFLLPGLILDQTREALLGYFEQDDTNTRSFVPYAITLLATIILTLAIYHCARLPRSEHITNSRYFAIFCSIVPTVAISAAFIFLDGTPTLASFFLPHFWMGLGIAAGVGAFFLAIFVYSKVSSNPPSRVMGMGLAGVCSIAVALLVGIALADVLLTRPPRIVDYTYGPTAFLVYGAQAIGPINIVLLSTAGWMYVFAGITTVSRWSGIPIVTILLLISFINGFFDLNDNHPVRRVPRTENVTPVLPSTGFSRWLSTRPNRAEYTDYPVVIVSAEGGGIRAAYFTAIILGQIVDRCPRAAQHIFAISGVSGGALGAAVYAAAMKSTPPNLESNVCDFSWAPPGRYETAFRNILELDHLSPILSRLLTSDLLQQFIPFPIEPFDRQIGLEHSIENAFRMHFQSDVIAESLYQLVPGPSSPAVPYLIMNATRVEDGQRITISPILFRTDQSSGADDWHVVDYLEGPSVSGAALTSARFPIVSPAGHYMARTVKPGPNGTWVADPVFIGKKTRFVDGGYFDNSALTTVAELYREIIDSRGGALEAGHKSWTVIVLHVGNAPECPIQSSFSPDLACQRSSGATAYSGWLGDLASMFQSAYNARQARVDYNFDEFDREVIDRRLEDKSLEDALRKALAENEFDEERLIKEALLIRPKGFDRIINIQMFDRGIATPLGWKISRRAATELTAQLRPREPLPDCDIKGDVASKNFCTVKNLLESLNEK